MIATTAPVIWPIALRVASFGDRPSSRHDALDVLDDDDRVVDDDADREHHAEQRQLVDREAEQAHAEERAEQRDRDHQRRDERRAEVLQEDQHHEEHEDRSPRPAS